MQLDTFRIEEDLLQMSFSSVDDAASSAAVWALYKSGDGCVPEARAVRNITSIEADWQRRDNVLFILDWDDTIFPTTWLTAKPWYRTWIRDKGSLENVELDLETVAALDALDAAAYEFLACVSRVATPVCITLSQRPWVEMSMKAFLPRLARFWEEVGISVHYAVEEYVATPTRQGFWCQKPSGAGGLEGTVLELHMRSNRKRKVMERVLRRFYRKNNNCWLHAVSIGDGLAERDALQEISMCHQNPRNPESGSSSRFCVKTIQMLEDPSCDHLQTQLEVLKTWTQVVMHSDEVPWEEEQQRFMPSVCFRNGQMIRYRGRRFIEEFRSMLSNSGGVFMYLELEEKPPADPKKPNPPETAELTRQCSGSAWIDLRSLIAPGSCRVETVCTLEGSDLLQGAGTFLRLSVELSFDVTPAEGEDMKVHPSSLLPQRSGPSKFSASDGAATSFLEAVERGCETIFRDCSKISSVEEAVTQLKEVNSYEDVKQGLRESIIRVFRERLRKETSAIPGRPLRGKAREDFISNAYSYLQLTTAEVLAKLHPSPDATDEVSDATKEGARLGRLAYEAELVGNWDRAAELLQNRFLLAQDLRSDPSEWVAFAKFCARRRGRQAAAEEALCQAAKLMGSGKDAPPELQLEVELFLACLVLERGRYEEAITTFQAKVDKDFANPMFRFLLGLALFLRCRFDEGRAYLESAGKPREWFKGLPDEAAVVDKLKAFRKTDGPPNLPQLAGFLDKLLSFGLPSLVFTFLDQTSLLSEESLASESMVLVDAKALALDRDLAGAVARVEPLLSSEATSYEVWKLAGECYVQLQDFDKALQALQTALAFDDGVEDPVLHIRLGSVLLVKKRWKQARDAFLRSIHATSTAEAWSGVAYAEFRSDELSTCYEALCEANLLDNERTDVWALLCLVHLRNENWDAADHACRQCLSLQPDCEELLLEVAMELQRKERQMCLAEVCARRALESKDSGQGHSVLADVLAQMGKAEASVLEAQVALKMLADQPEIRKVIFSKALKLCQELEDAPLTEALHACQKLAD
ncbi:Cfap70, partial [Symbiodinium pilosum]